MGPRGGVQPVPGRRTGFASPSRTLPLLASVVVLTYLSMGVLHAHWASQTGLAMETTTGDVVLDVAGDLSYSFPACTAGSESRACDKFDSDVIGTAPLSYSAGGAAFTITGWVYKGGDRAEPVGFYYTISGGSVDIDVKSGQNHDTNSLSEGSGYWLNPACQGDPGPGGAVTCRPRNTSAISHVDFCIKVATSQVCPPPLMHSVVASNVGTIPFRLQMSLIGPADPGADYCGVLDLTLNRLIEGSPEDPPLYQGPICGLIGIDLPVADQIDPGESAEYEISLSFSQPTSAVNGTASGFTARFAATQWNYPSGWMDVVDLPIAISVGPAPALAPGAGALPGVSPATITTKTVSVSVNSSLPSVIDVFGRSAVTIVAWAMDPDDSSGVLGFEFTVSGDPVYVEVHRGGAAWVDERWEEENPHIWHDPYGVGSSEAIPITSIEFGLVNPEGPPTQEPIVEPPAPEPPAEEPPALQVASLTGIVWLDVDLDGIRGSTEGGLASVVVRILKGDIELATVITAADGSYRFGGLDVGDYAVEIAAPEGYVFSPTDQGGDPDLDSDMTAVDSTANPLLGRVTVSLAAGHTAGLADAGLHTPPAEGGGG